MLASTYLSPSSIRLQLTTTTHGLLLSGNRTHDGKISKKQHGISPSISPNRSICDDFLIPIIWQWRAIMCQVSCLGLKPGWAMTTAAAAAVARSFDHGDTRKTQIIIVFLLRTLLLMCIIARRVVALIRIVCRAPARSLFGVSRVVFSVVNGRCLWCLDQAALGRSCTGTLCGDLLVGAMANSWRLLVQGLTSVTFLCVHADEYVRPPPSPLLLVAHDKPALHPQQVHISIVGANNMRISWVTDDRSAPSVVEYGTSQGKYTASATGDHTTYRYFFYKSGAIHHVTVGPLEPSTTYYYRCGQAGDEFSLRTPPATMPIELVVIGDLGQTGVDGVDAEAHRRRGLRHAAATRRPVVRGHAAAAVGHVRAAGAAAGERAAVDGDGGEPRDRDAPRGGVRAVRGVQRAVADAARGERFAFQPLLLLRRRRRRGTRRNAGLVRGVRGGLGATRVARARPRRR